MDEELRYPLPTDTAHVNLESKQYKLGIDLGEGVLRITLLFGAVFGITWIAALQIMGVPLISYIWCYLAPPGLLTIFALRKDRGGRYAYITLVDRYRYLKRRHRPIVPLPGHPAPTSIVSRRWANLVPVHRNRPRIVRAEFLVIDITLVKGTKP